MRHRLLLIAGLVTIAAIGWVDYITGPDAGLSLLYIIPVIASGWWLGYRSALTTAALAAGSWLLADLPWHPQDYLAVSLWNTFTRLVMYISLGVLTARVRLDRNRLAEINARLEGLLAQETALARTDALTHLPNPPALPRALGQSFPEVNLE